VIQPNAVFALQSGGGGGYGPPEERDPAARAWDAANGFVARGDA